MILTVLVIVTVVLINSVFGSLATQYEWGIPMNAEANYDVTSVCYRLLDSAFATAASDEDKRSSKVEIIFCDTEEMWQSDVTQNYLYHTAKSLDEKYEQITLSFHDVYLNPNAVKKYAKNPQTGEDQFLSLSDVIIVCDDYYRVYKLQDFFAFTDVKMTDVLGYSGERKLAAGVMRALNQTPNLVCFTKNHGEIFYDYELVNLLDDAGYEIKTDFDLSTEEIPQNCSLLITYNPNSDLDFSIGIDEGDKLDHFLEKDGNNYLVFVSNGTPSLKNMESYLKEWGVETSYHTDVATGKSYRYTVQDTEQSLTSDGYTIYGQRTAAAESFQMPASNVVFKNATALTNADSYIPTGDGSYVKGDRTLYSVYESAPSSVLWANGIAARGESSMLMTLTEQKNETGGKSYVGVVSSVDFGSRTQLQSAVFENQTVLQRTFGVMGQTDTTEGLKLKPFASTNISSITTAQMLRWTIGLTVIPAVVIAVVGIVVLIRRRRA